MKKILVVDNHPVMLKFMRNRLEEKGYDVSTAENGVNALSILESLVPDILFIDLVMPKISGEQLCRIVRSIPKLHDVRIVILSGIAAEKEVDFVALGADACIAKGPLNKMSTHVFSVIDQLEKGQELNLSKRVIGVEDVYAREVTSELLLSKMHSEAILGNMSEGIMELTREGQIIYANPISVLLTGLPEETLLASYFIDFFSGDDLKRVSDILKKIKNAPKEISEDSPVLLNDRQVSLNIIPMRFREYECLIVIMQDISEKRRLEEKLRHAQKMEAIGTFAGGIAHEFNNALYAISGNIELLQLQFPKQEKLQKQLDSVLGPISRMSNLIDKLLAYAQEERSDFQRISISSFLKSALPVFEQSVNPQIKIALDLVEDISKVRIDYSQLKMVLSVIIANASEAIEEKGNIRISASNEIINKDSMQADATLKAGSYACITIKDDGKGMDQESRIKIFDPFFSTKFQGRGLSMAAAYGIIRNHDGTISVESELGKGTTVRIFLPASEPRLLDLEGMPADLVQGTGTILLVEDEDIVMEVTRSTLEQSGYHVLPARTGGEAIKIAKSFDGAIDSAILDIGLPDITGDAVYGKIMKARPNLKVIVCSGYPEDDRVQEILDAGAQGFLQKPFALKSLSKKLKEVSNLN